jgi:adenosylhomocysteine nucleosidase
MSNQPILFTFAVPQESRDFRRLVGGRNGAAIHIAHVGVGPLAAGNSMKRLLSELQPRLVISTGFAGGLDPRLATGDLVVAENFSSPEVVDRVRAFSAPGKPPALGKVVSYPSPIESVADKAAVARETGALAVDMESEAIASQCRLSQVPLLVVRVISDPAREPLPVPFADWFEIDRQRPNVFGLLKYLALHPGRIGPFAHFVRGLAPARRHLAEFLVTFLSNLQTSF